MNIKVNGLYKHKGNFGQPNKGDIFRVRLIEKQKVYVVGSMYPYTIAQFKKTHENI